RLDHKATPGGLVVDYAPGARRARARAELEAIGFHSPEGEFNQKPVAFVGLDLREADLAPRLLALLMAALASAVLIHLVLTRARVRRRELATLRALGFTRGQVRAALAWSATTVTLASLLLAALIGVVAGRFAWERYATGLDVVPEAALPWVLGGAIVGA